MSVDVEKYRDLPVPKGLPFKIEKIGHVVLMVADLDRSVEFYTQVLGFEISDVYPEDMVPGGMVFMRCSPDHHGVALVGQGEGKAGNIELHHMAFEVASLDQVLRAREHLRARQVPIDFEGRRRAGCQIAVEFRDPDNHSLEIYWGIDKVGSGGEVRSPDEWDHAFSLEEAIGRPVPGQDTSLRDPSLLE